MSIMSKDPRIAKETKMLVDIKECTYIYWSPSRARRLKALLGKVTDLQVSNLMVEKGHKCSRQLVSKIVNGSAESVNAELLVDICSGFNLDISEVIPVRIEQETKEFSD